VSILDFLKRLPGGGATTDPAPEAASQPAQMKVLLASLPDQVEKLDIGVHTGQDQDGFLTVMAHPARPDIAVLNKAVAPCRTLFEAKIVDGWMQPDMPAVNPFGKDFPTAKVMFEVALDWVLALWDAAEGAGSCKGGQVLAAEGMAGLAPRALT